MAVIKGGISGANWEIESLSKAGRVLPYDAQGNYRGVKPTYRAAITGLVCAAGTAPFLLIEGSAGKTVIVQRVVLSGPTLTAVGFINYEARKYSSAASGGTATLPVPVEMDSSDGSATAVVRAYTVAPTVGALVGVIAARRALGQTATAAAGARLETIEFDFRNNGENKGLYLRGAAQALALAFGTAPASAVTLSGWIEWTEE